MTNKQKNILQSDEELLVVLLCPTLYIKNSRDSSKLRDCSPIQLHCKLKRYCSAIGYYSYTKRYQT